MLAQSPSLMVPHLCIWIVGRGEFAIHSHGWSALSQLTTVQEWGGLLARAGTFNHATLAGCLPFMLDE
jgi:hypothetical protein